VTLPPPRCPVVRGAPALRPAAALLKDLRRFGEEYAIVGKDADHEFASLKRVAASCQG